MQISTHQSEQPIQPVAPLANASGGFMTVRQFMASYGIGRTTVYRLAARGAITIIKIGRASRISRAEAERWASSLPTLAA